jgi:hypothetical protein
MNSRGAELMANPADIRLWALNTSAYSLKSEA